MVSSIQVIFELCCRDINPIHGDCLRLHPKSYPKIRPSPTFKCIELLTNISQRVWKIFGWEKVRLRAENIYFLKKKILVNRTDVDRCWPLLTNETSKISFLSKNMFFSKNDQYSSWRIVSSFWATEATKHSKTISLFMGIKWSTYIWPRVWSSAHCSPMYLYSD